MKIDEAIQEAQNARLKELSAECRIDTKELDEQLVPIIESCTKDAISVSWCHFGI